jgi:hypothetical protein
VSELRLEILKEKPSVFPAASKVVSNFSVGYIEVDRELSTALEIPDHAVEGET